MIVIIIINTDLILIARIKIIWLVDTDTHFQPRMILILIINTELILILRINFSTRRGT